VSGSGRPSQPSRDDGRRRGQGSGGRDQSRGRRQDGPGKPGGGRDKPGGSRDKPRSYSRPRRDDTRSEVARTADQAVYDGPPIDEAITGKELDRSISQQLRGLPEKLAARVARHLVAAGLLMDSDPRTAYQHTLAARARASRLAVVREACGEAAYACGEFADALSELRAAKRMNGSTEYLAVMADCERALGRPDRALALLRSPAVANFPPDLKAEVTIVEAGARSDRGELDAALHTLEAAPLRSQSREAWVVRLRYAYADTLLKAGRTEEAVEWFHRTVAIDGEEITDAEERVAELEGDA
jgi:tetratricopeptide (TPR) repeat protein